MANDSAKAVTGLKAYLATDCERRAPLTNQAFAKVPLTKVDAVQAAKLLQIDHRNRIKRERADEMKTRVLTWKDAKMPFFYKVFGKKPRAGRSLYISMHGGGGAPPQVNTRQWENQKRLYAPKEGVYVAPRAPTDTWNLWHQGHIDPLFRRLIENLVVFESVDPNRVYLLGYSAGGDGVYQLAPRMADSFAAASMMAGHPNETKPQGLRNLPFSIHVGERDNGYNRNKVAGQWKDQLATLAKTDPKGYVHWVKIYPGKGHWMDREDAAALPWMAKFRRNRFPDRIVWRQDNVTHNRFYWLSMPDGTAKGGDEVVARHKGQRFDVDKSDPTSLNIRLSDEFVDLNRPVVIYVNGKKRFEGIANRTIEMLSRTLEERGDPDLMFSAEVAVETK